MIYALTLNWNGLDKLKRLLPSLNEAVKNLDDNLIWYIRDNGSKDGSQTWIEEQEKREDLNFKIKHAFLDHNRDNFARGMNMLVALAQAEYEIDPKGDFFLFLNNDVEIKDASSLSNMKKLMKDPKVGVVGARLLYTGTNKLQHAGVIFGPRYGNMPYHFRHQEESDENATKNRYFQAVTAACCLVRVQAMESFSEEFNWAFDDIDLMLRIGKNYKIAYCGQTTIYHEESASLKKNPVNKLFLPNNVKLFKEKWFGKYELDHEKYLNNPQYRLI